jgi:sec-independent protein translocase protein TatA
MAYHNEMKAVELSAGWQSSVERSTKMFGLGPVELIIILLILVVLFGASRLRGLGGALGGSIREFKQAVREEDSTVPPATTAAPTLPTTNNTVPPVERIDQPERRV